MSTKNSRKDYQSVASTEELKADLFSSKDTKLSIDDSSTSDNSNGDNSNCCQMEALRRKCCTKKALLKRVPILSWLPKYTVSSGVSDLIAGITVGLTVIPQGIAYAIVADLPPQYGLYSAFMGCFVYCIFGSSKDITVGPTAIMALMTAEHANKGADFAVLLTFLSGLIITSLGMLHLGFVIDFISIPVTAGFTSAAAVTIASSQIKALFGLEIVEHSHIHGIVGTYIEIFSNITSIRYQDTILGITCVVALLLMRQLGRVDWFKEVSDPEDASRCQSICLRFSPTVRKVLSKLLWVVGTARNAIIVIICLGIAYGFDPVIPDDPRNSTFILTGEIESGLPPFELPPFNADFNVTTNGTTVITHLNFPGMVKELGSAIVIIPLISILESVAIAKAFSGGKPVDANQEMIALGLCNFVGSFVSSMPVTGSFSRTAVNSASGVKTPMGGVFTGALVILAVAVLMPLCAYIPKATLAAVIITAVIFMIEYEVIKPMWRSKKSDLFSFLISFICCLFWALEFGILIGVFVQVVIVLYNTARPQVEVHEDQLHGPDTTYLIARLDRAVVFPSVNYVRNIINKAGLKQGRARIPVVIDCKHIFTTDFTAAEGFESMVLDFKKRNQAVLFYQMKSPMEHTFRGIGHDAFIICGSQQELQLKLAEIFSMLPPEDPLNEEDLLPENLNGTGDPLLHEPTA